MDIIGNKPFATKITKFHEEFVHLRGIVASLDCAQDAPRQGYDALEGRAEQHRQNDQQGLNIKITQRNCVVGVIFVRDFICKCN